MDIDRDIIGKPIRSTNTVDDRYDPVLLFSKLNTTFVGYFDPEKIFLDNENR